MQKIHLFRNRSPLWLPWSVTFCVFLTFSIAIFEKEKSYQAVKEKEKSYQAVKQEYQEIKNNDPKYIVERVYQNYSQEDKLFIKSHVDKALSNLKNRNTETLLRSFQAGYIITSDSRWTSTPAEKKFNLL